ncbi:MAG: hypothetical protein CM1200mP28_01640 [Deltaproteobacteria bacterium]|nr:MAG: hypothetical protein CM1200mP28_01640 [Deltaproteobacteria bacterium]
MDQRIVELDIAERPSGAVMEFMPISTNDNMDINIRDMLANMMPKQSKRRRVSIEDARNILQQEEVGKLIDMEEVSREAVKRVEQSGIIFLDEVDKVASRRSHSQGPDISREGVKARPAAYCRRIYSKHKIRTSSNRPYSIHCRRGFPPYKTV